MKKLFAAGAMAITLVVSAPTTAQAVATNTWYKNGGTYYNVLVKSNRWTNGDFVTIHPGQTYVVYGDSKYGWVATHCELQQYYSGSWHHLADAYGRTGYWKSLPQSVNVTLRTYCP